MSTIPKRPQSAVSKSGWNKDAATNSLAVLGCDTYMERTHEYQIINDAAPAIETALTAQSAAGWRPILMSTATVASGQVQVFIILEKSIPAPYAK